MTLSAGAHPFDLDVVHADLGPEALLRHLAADHKHPVDRRMGAAVAQHTHRELHEMTRDATDPVGLLDRQEKARQAAKTDRDALDALAGAVEAWVQEEDLTGEHAHEDGLRNALERALAHFADTDDPLPELLRLARRGQAMEAGALALAEELDREAEHYVTSVEKLPTPTERTSAAARAITSGGAANRLRDLVADTTGEATE